MNGFTKDMVSVVLKQLKKKGVDVHTSAKAISSSQDDDGVSVTYEEDGKQSTIKADYCMVTVGRRPNTDDLGLEYTSVKVNDHGIVETDEQGRTASQHIFAVGDIASGPALAHKAFFQGKVAAGAIAGKNTANDYAGVPAVCFSDPELAVVGLTEAQAKDKDIEVATSKFPFAGNARAVSLDQVDGFARLIYTKDDKTILGGEVVGPGASDLIAELSLAVNSHMNVEDISLTIHPHPTLSEPIQEAADVALGYPTHI